MEKCFVQGFVEAELQSICNDINRQQGFQKGGVQTCHAKS